LKREEEKDKRDFECKKMIYKKYQKAGKIVG